MTDVILPLLFWVVWTALVAIVAHWGSSKRLGFGWSLAISALLSPLIGAVAVLISGDIKDPERTPAEVSFDDAQRHMYKEEYPHALNHYQDALYYISREPDTTSRTKSMAVIESKIETIKRKLG